MANLSLNRPTSVMSLLADQMQSSCLNEMRFVESCKAQSIDFPSISNEPCTISSSAPVHRHSIPGTCSSCINLQNDSTMEPVCQVPNESDLSSPQLPSKRLCHSTTNEFIARPIPIKSNIKPDYNKIQDFNNGNGYNRISCPKATMSIKTPQRNSSHFTIRPIISPHYKKSAFTPTGSLTSPQTTSSDYSISPDMESPIYRPASVTSSGFQDCSQQSLLIDPNYSPESNQKSSCETIINTKPSDGEECILPRCHSQPCDESITKNISRRTILINTDKTCSCHHQPSTYQSQFHTSMKRRYPSLSHIRSTSHSVSYNVQNSDSPVHCLCNKRIPNSADTSPNACGSLFAVPKRDSYFFGSGRSYLISLPRIASSPPPVSLQVDPQNPIHGHRQRIGSNSSSLSTSTTTDANTPTVVSNGGLQQKSTADSTNYNSDDVDMEDSFHENRSTITCTTDHNCCDNFDSTPEKNPPRIWSDLNVMNSNTHGTFLCTSISSCSVSTTSDMTTKSYSTNSDSTSNCTNISHSINSESSRSEFRDPDDPPEIGFCFSQLNDHSDTVAYDENSSFQELDLDQIELD